MVTGLQNTIEKTVQKKKSNTSIENNKNLKLSIQFSLDGFSFCVIAKENNKDLFFSKYTFDETLKSPQELLENITYIFKNDKNLQHDFEEVQVIHQNNLNTLVPQDYFNEKHLLKYLDYNIKTLPTDLAAFDEIDIIQSNMVFIPYTNINNYLFQHFGAFEYKHHTTVFIEKLLEIESSNEAKVYVNVFKTSFDVAVLKEKKLLFINSFSYKTKEDFLYYILFVAEQLELDTHYLNLYFSGEINEQSEHYKLAYNYIKNLFFLESKNDLFNQLEEPKHSNFMLLFS